MPAKDSESEFPVRDARRCAQEWDRRRLVDGLAVRSWIMPRRQKLARAKRKVKGGKRIANGTAGQTRPFLRATPVGSVGFGQLLVRTAERTTVRKNRGRITETPLGQAFRANFLGYNGRVLQRRPGCKTASRNIIRGAKKKDAL